MKMYSEDFLNFAPTKVIAEIVAQSRAMLTDDKSVLEIPPLGFIMEHSLQKEIEKMGIPSLEFIKTPTGIEIHKIPVVIGRMCCPNHPDFHGKEITTFDFQNFQLAGANDFDVPALQKIIENNRIEWIADYDFHKVMAKSMIIEHLQHPVDAQLVFQNKKEFYDYVLQMFLDSNEQYAKISVEEFQKISGDKDIGSSLKYYLATDGSHFNINMIIRDNSVFIHNSGYKNNVEKTSIYSCFLVPINEIPKVKRQKGTTSETQSKLEEFESIFEEFINSNLLIAKIVAALENISYQDMLNILCQDKEKQEEIFTINDTGTIYLLNKTLLDKCLDKNVEDFKNNILNNLNLQHSSYKTIKEFKPKKELIDKIYHYYSSSISRKNNLGEFYKKIINEFKDSGIKIAMIKEKAIEEQNKINPLVKDFADSFKSHLRKFGNEYDDIRIRRREHGCYLENKAINETDFRKSLESIYFTPVLYERFYSTGQKTKREKNEVIDFLVGKINIKEDWGATGSRRDFNTIPDNPDNFIDYLFLKWIKSVLNKLIAELPPRERYTIEHRFNPDTAKNQTLEEIGSVLNVTRERARQFETKGLKMLAEKIFEKNIVEEDINDLFNYMDNRVIEYTEEDILSAVGTDLELFLEEDTLEEDL